MLVQKGAKLLACSGRQINGLPRAPTFLRPALDNVYRHQSTSKHQI